MLPDYLIIGASRTGTTWIMEALSEHPQVCIPLRELNFFSNRWDKGLKWYQEFFKGCKDKTKIEKSPSYLRSKECPRRIYKVIPNVELIAILRSPVERVYSQYKMQLSAGSVSPDIEKILSLDSYYVREGLYFKHLQAYLEYFNRKQLHILFYDDLKRDSKEFYKNLCRILGIDETYHPNILGIKHHSSKSPPRSKLMVKLKNAMITGLHKTEIGDRIVSFLKRGKLSNLYYRINGGGNFPPLSPKLKAKLTQFYKEDVKKLEDFLNKDLNHWIS